MITKNNTSNSSSNKIQIKYLLNYSKTSEKVPGIHG